MTAEYSALIESIDGKFRASASAPFGLTAFGETESEALDKLDAEVRARLRHGARVVFRRIEEEAAHPLARFAGDLKDDPLKDDWLTAMEAYRRDVENDPDYL